MRSRPSKPLMWFLFIACALLFGLASAGAVFAKKSKVDICHVNRRGEYHLRSIRENKYATHLAHGDKAVETFYVDADGDGFGSSSLTVEDCNVPEGFVADDTDCDDTNAAVNPGAAEIQGNGIDDDCSPGTIDNPLICPCSDLHAGGTQWHSMFATFFVTKYWELCSCEIRHRPNRYGFTT